MAPAALEWVARFRRYLGAERRLSRHTDAAYARDLAALVQFCDRNALRDWRALDSAHIRRFAARQHAAGLAPRSIQRRLSAVRSFYAFLLRERLARLGPDGKVELCSDPSIAAIKSNPGTEVRAPKAARKLPRTLDPDRMTRLLEMPTDGALAARD